MIGGIKVLSSLICCYFDIGILFVYGYGSIEVWGISIWMFDMGMDKVVFVGKFVVGVKVKVVDL